MTPIVNDERDRGRERRASRLLGIASPLRGEANVAAARATYDALAATPAAA